jgi:hypothetical protein
LTRALIDSDYGVFEAVGPGMLKVRINEIEAMAKLEALEDSDEFTQGAKDTADDKVAAVKQVIDQPQEALEGLGEGVTRFFKRTYRSTKTGVQKALDVYNEQTPGVTEGAGANLPGAGNPEIQNEGESKYARAARVSGRVAVNILGFDEARRSLAKRLGVDPYSTNSIFNEKLDQVAMDIFAGGLAVDIATSLIPGSILISTSTLVTDWVWDTPPGDLRVAIEDKLQEIGVEKEEIDALLRHQWYPLSMQAAMARALDSMQGVDGIADIMPLVLSVTYYDQARFVVSTLAMLAKYHATVKPLQALEVHGTIVGSDQDGRLVVTAPADYVSWNEGLETFSTREDFEDRKRYLHLQGEMSKTALEKLERVGWHVEQNSPLFWRPSDDANRDG